MGMFDSVFTTGLVCSACGAMDTGRIEVQYKLWIGRKTYQPDLRQTSIGDVVVGMPRIPKLDVSGCWTCWCEDTEGDECSHLNEVLIRFESGRAVSVRPWDDSDCETVLPLPRRARKRKARLTPRPAPERLHFTQGNLTTLGRVLAEPILRRLNYSWVVRHAFQVQPFGEVIRYSGPYCKKDQSPHRYKDMYGRVL